VPDAVTSRTDRIGRSQRLVSERRAARRGNPERSFLTIADLSDPDVADVLAGGLDVKRNPAKYGQLLRGKSVALLFQKTSTRTRVSFEIGVGEMGGQPVYLDWRTSNFTLADLQDEIRVLSRYVDLIMARVYSHNDLEVMKQYSEVPVINGLSDLSHPCQGLTDYMTMLEYFGSLKGLRVGYLGDGNNVCHSLIEGAIKTGARIVVAHAPGYPPDAEIVARGVSAGVLTVSTKPADAVREADVIYTDTWVSMGEEAEKEVRLRAFAEFQVNEALVGLAPPHALIMHCLPAHRGYEITPGVLDSENSVVFDQAENRKHLQKFLMARILELA
jgi:ornithine carbamoyltransferase